MAGKGKPKTGGRRKGSPNRITRVVREAVVRAAELEGMDGKGKGKLVGYMRKLARESPSVFGPLLGRIVPTEVTGEFSTTHEKALDELERAANGGE